MKNKSFQVNSENIEAITVMMTLRPIGDFQHRLHVYDGGEKVKIERKELSDSTWHAFTIDGNWDDFYGVNEYLDAKVFSSVDEALGNIW